LESAPERAVSAWAAEQVVGFLALAVSDGTARRAGEALAAVAGKTGTTQHYGVWFAGFAPANAPQWSICVYIENGLAGGNEGAEVFRRIVDGIIILEGMPIK